MKKKSISPINNLTLTAEALKASLPSPEVIGKTVEHIISEIKQEQPKERNTRKRETAKGTILQAVMIEKELLKKVKHSAFYNEKSISEVINQALRLFFD